MLLTNTDPQLHVQLKLTNGIHHNDHSVVDELPSGETITNSTITNITFSHRTVEKYSTNYGQPITILEMDSGAKLKFSINFGEVDDEDRAAYFDFLITT
jgi:hypothetical protein